MEIFAIPAVGAIIEREYNGEKEILIQERYKEGEDIEKGLLELPAGKIREYENIFDALRREVFEETGLSIVSIVGESDIMTTDVNGYVVNSYMPFFCSQNLSGGYSILLQTFLCKAEGELLSSTNETKNIHWESVNSIKKLIKNSKELWYPLHINVLLKYFSWLEKKKS